MTDVKETGDKGGSGRRLSLSRRSVETSQVRQSFSHGRSKAVLVEKKRKRAAPPGTETPAKPTPAKAAPAETPAPEAKAPAPEAQEARAKSSGVVLPSLTDQEKAARAKALEFAREREVLERKQAEEDAKRRAEEDARKQQAAAENAAREAEEEARRAAEAAERKAAEEEAARQLAAEEEAKKQAAAAAPADDKQARAAKPRETPAQDDRGPKRRGGGAQPARPTPARRNEPKRRSGKLTVTSALNDEERVRSVAAFRRAQERARRAAQGHQPRERAKVVRDVRIPDAITVQELSNRMAERAADVIKTLMKMDVMATVTQTIDADTAQIVAEEMGHKVVRVSEAAIEEGVGGAPDDEADLKPRPAVVTVMGHVDHGKTSLLDAMRATDVVAGEAGGITQHIGAYQVRLSNGERITFIDTPGHAAFTAMRARGAKATDIVILVVAADDGVMPQTIEAINHARAAEAPIIVAINKIDKPGVNPDRVKQELLQHEIVVESLGGDVQTVEVSALKKTGLDKLEEAILLQAEILELTANPDREAEGAVIEAKLDKGRGPVATVLVQRGSLQQGDIFVAGAEWGRARALVNERGEQLKTAGPSTPVEVLGLQGAPEAGDQFVVVEDEARAREIAEYRQRKARESRVATGARASLEAMMSQIGTAERQEMAVVIKGDVQGSVEAIAGALEKLGTDEVAVRVLHSGVGGVTESDITLAGATAAPILAFNVRANKQARDQAQQQGVEIRYYSIIYDLVDDIKAVLSGMLSPERRETFIGYAEVREVFAITKVGKVAGCLVTEGVARRSAGVRLLRDDVVIHEGELSTLKRFKDEVKEVRSGQECGMAFTNYQDIQKGDVIEIFEVEEVARQI